MQSWLDFQIGHPTRTFFISFVQPLECLLLFFQSGINDGAVVGRNIFFCRSLLQLAQNLNGVVAKTGTTANMCVASHGKSCLRKRSSLSKFPQRVVIHVFLLVSQPRKEGRPKADLIKLRGLSALCERLVVLARKVIVPRQMNVADQI